MNKKNIQIIIILVCFGAAGLVLYNGFFKKSGPTVNPNIAISQVALQNNLGSIPAGGSTITSPAGILPNGNSLNFKRVVNPKRFEYNQYNYPKLDPNGEIGIEENKLIPPVASQ